jgi:hypothetical protein
MNKKQINEVVKAVTHLKSTISQYEAIAHNPQLDFYRGEIVALKPKEFASSLEKVQKNLDFILDQVLNQTDEE